MADEQEKFVNICQYWCDYEPSVCSNWNDGKCIDTEAANYPYCNRIGTMVECTSYEGNAGAKINRCILPDPRRHTCNKNTGKKWTSILNGKVDYSDISGYNEFQCDGSGTDTTCSGYSPHHLGFGIIQPSSDEDISLQYPEKPCLTGDELGYRLPTHLVVYNIRAKLSKCHWWKADSGVFTVNPQTGKSELSEWKCQCTVDTTKYNDFSNEFGPPCNGAKPECSNYTGICWVYCIDEKLEFGDPILAEQIHELRYYHREDDWTVEAIEKLFIDEGYLYTWDDKDPTKDEEIAENDTEVNGSLKGFISEKLDENGNLEEYEIPSIKVSMSTFDKFTLDHEDLVLSTGTTVDSELENYPTLIRELQQLPLSPIIKSKFNSIQSGFYNDSDPINIFETPYLNKTTKITICAKLFYSSQAYALNLSDKELSTVLPRELYYFDDVYSIEAALSDENFNGFKKRFSNTMDALLNIFPDKIIYNSFSQEDFTFLADIEILGSDQTADGSNNNTFIVIQEYGGYATYDKITVRKSVIGGVVIQTSFNIEGEGNDVIPPVPHFEKSFMAEKNDNAKINFQFCPFITDGYTTEALYLYNDALYEDPKQGTNLIAHKLYKSTEPSYVLGSHEFKMVGSNGLILIILDHPYINNIFRPWEVESIFVADCEMEIFKHSSEGTIPVNQLLIRPKDLSTFSAVCKETTTIILNNLSYWEKRSFEEEPFSEDAIEQEYPTLGWSNSLDAGIISGDYNSTFEITEFKFTMTLCMIMADSSGRPFCQTRVKPLGMVKQVACPEVEVFYNWAATYSYYQNIPSCVNCCGPRQEVHLESGIKKTMKPLCGDHFECAGCYPAAVWWPFNRCQDYMSYSQVTNLDNYDISMRELFKDKDADGNFIHGSHDMRMLCPDEHFARTGLGCPPRDCFCDFETFNWHKQSDYYFNGFAKLRSGVSPTQVSIWAECGSNPVMQFGNELRSVLRTYLTTDQVLYMRNDFRPPRVESLLMPAAQMFSNSDITLDSFDDEPWSYYCSNEGPNVINQLGFLLANSFDGIDINEEIDVETRFRFDDIIESTFASNLAYPRTTGKYIRVVGDSIVTPWYEFKTYPGTDQAIQWAWREPWKQLERFYIGNDFNSFGEFIESFSEENTAVNNMKAPFKNGTGIFSALEITYPEYKYDYVAQEFRLVANENESAQIKFFPPDGGKDEYTGEYSGYISIQLNDGPQRYMTLEGGWLTEEQLAEDSPDYAEQQEDDDTLSDYNTQLYDKCTDVTPIEQDEEQEEPSREKWLSEVSLFDTGYDDSSEEKAEEDKRMYQDLDSWGDFWKYYFQRGLSVEILVGAMNTFPLQLTYVGTMEGDYAKLSAQTVANFSMAFDGLKTIGKISISYKLGEESVLEETYIYNAPTISIYTFIQDPDGGMDGGELGDLIHSETLSNERNTDESTEITTERVEWRNTWDYIIHGKNGIILEAYLDPANISTSGNNVFEITNIQVYEEVLAEATEPIAIYERKYYVSYGNSGNYPPQGKDGEKVLTPIHDWASTCFQVDDHSGVKGILNSDGPFVSMNKVRGRSMSEVRPDEEVLTGQISEIENLQKVLFDEAADKVQPNSSMKIIMPPGLENLLKKNGVTLSLPSTLNLNNTLINPLAEINQFPQMAAGGHAYDPHPTGSNRGCRSPCIQGDGFSYRYTDRDTNIGDHAMADIFTQFYWGSIWFMDRREMDRNLKNGLFQLQYSRDTANRIFKKEASALGSSLIFPSLSGYIKPLGGFSASGNYAPKKRQGGATPFWLGWFFAGLLVHSGIY